MFGPVVSPQYFCTISLACCVACSIGVQMRLLQLLIPVFASLARKRGAYYFRPSTGTDDVQDCMADLLST